MQTRRRNQRRNFNSRTSCEVRLSDGSETSYAILISTHAPLARCDVGSSARARISQISTHAPLARCDVAANTVVAQIMANFNSRTSCEVRPADPHPLSGNPSPFQLTHLLRGATYWAWLTRRYSTNFNSRTSCEVRRAWRNKYKPIADFNSRTSCEVRPARRHGSANAVYFNSRTSCEVRLLRDFAREVGVKFQLTHLLRGATTSPRRRHGRKGISTHAPLARCDLVWE